MPEWIGELVDLIRVRPGSKVVLSDAFDPAHTAFVKKRDSERLLAESVALLSASQERLAAQDTHGVLLCLQALDAAGKDGVVRHVISGVNPQGVHVTSFGVPSTEELLHDYLWRYARSAAGTGRDRDLQPVPLRGSPRGARAP